MEAFFTFCRDHFAFAILMFGMSLTAATLVIWRLLLNFSARTNMDQFLPEFQQAKWGGCKIKDSTYRELETVSSGPTRRKELPLA